MSILATLRNKKKDKAGEARALLEAAQKENRSVLTAEEVAKKDALFEEIRGLDVQIEAQEKIDAALTSSDSPESRKVTVVRDEADDEKGEKRSKFSCFGEQLLAVRTAAISSGASIDKRLTSSNEMEGRAASGLNEAVGTDGGFLVDKEFSSSLIEAAIIESQLAQLVDNVPLGPGKNGLKVNAVQGFDMRDGYQFGGVQAYWDNEADQLTASKPKFTQMQWQLKKLTGLCYATDEALEDAISLGKVIDDSFRSVFAFKIDQAILWGSGTGQPLGVHNSAAMITVSKESGQANGTFVANNAIKMFSRLLPQARQDAVWIINSDVEPQLYTMYLPTGTNSGTLLYTPSQGMAGYPYGTLLGRKVIPMMQAKTLGTLGDITLMSPKNYLTISKGQIKKDVSIHVRFLYNEQAFRFVLRIDGAPKLPTVITPAEGSSSLSAFVRLEAR